MRLLIESSGNFGPSLFDSTIAEYQAWSVISVQRSYAMALTLYLVGYSKQSMLNISHIVPNKTKNLNIQYIWEIRQTSLMLVAKGTSVFASHATTRVTRAWTISSTSSGPWRTLCGRCCDSRKDIQCWVWSIGKHPLCENVSLFNSACPYIWYWKKRS